VPIPEVGGNFRILPAVKVLATPRVMSLKNLDRDRFTVMLYDYRDGALLAIVAARWLGAIRTGATSAVATRYMARPMGADWP
jgi:alanine dehydrogenase